VLRVLVVDDEEPARTLLREYLGRAGGVQIVGECRNGFEAVKAVHDLQPDLLFLDIQMPKLNGFEVLELLGRDVAVVFATAFDEHAIKAFEVNAVDYLLKPVSAARLRETLNRAQERLERADLRVEALRQVRLAAGEYEKAVPPERLERLPVRQGDRILLLPVAQIASIRAEGELLHVTTARSGRHTVACRLKDLERKLDPARFVRLGRGELANIDLITRVNVMPGGTYVVVLQNGQELAVSRIQSRILRDRLLRL
jgi:two-component system LytT family response regulator